MLNDNIVGIQVFFVFGLNISCYYKLRLKAKLNTMLRQIMIILLCNINK